MIASFYNSDGTRFSLEDVEGTLIPIAVDINGKEQEKSVKGWPGGEAKEKVVPGFYARCVLEGLRPMLALEIEKGNRVLQKEPTTINAYTKLSDEERLDESLRYFETKQRMQELEEEAANEIKKIKDQYKAKIAAEQVILDTLESVITHGVRSEQVQASWERDIEECVMVQIRHDNLAVLAVRAIEEDGVENQCNILEGGKIIDESEDEDLPEPVETEDAD